MQTIVVVSIFPQMLESALQYGILRRVLGKSLHVLTLDLRNHGLGPYQSVDDRPFGGGPGMVLRLDVLVPALRQAQALAPQAKVVAFSPAGEVVSQKTFSTCAENKEDLIFFCGRYEGFDQRFLDYYVDECWSVGDFVLSGGELPALICIDAIGRLHPGALSDPQSAVLESFASSTLDYPHYTRPLSYEGYSVPEVLLSGHHEKIESWREQEALKLTTRLRPDLLVEHKKR